MLYLLLGCSLITWILAEREREVLREKMPKKMSKVKTASVLMNKYALETKKAREHRKPPIL